jgi:hypothetical protein
MLRVRGEGVRGSRGRLLWRRMMSERKVRKVLVEDL